jgi:hypothetical protein
VAIQSDCSRVFLVFNDQQPTTPAHPYERCPGRTPSVHATFKFGVDHDTDARERTASSLNAFIALNYHLLTCHSIPSIFSYPRLHDADQGMEHARKLYKSRSNSFGLDVCRYPETQNWAHAMSNLLKSKSEPKLKKQASSSDEQQAKVRWQAQPLTLHIHTIYSRATSFCTEWNGG